MRVIHYTPVHLTISVRSKTSLSPAGNSMFLSKGLQWSCSDYPHHMSSCVQPVSRHPPHPPPTPQPPLPPRCAHKSHLDIADLHLCGMHATAEKSLTLRRFHIHILRHPLLLQSCKSCLQRGEKVEKNQTRYSTGLTSSIWPSLLRNSSWVLQVLLLQTKESVELYEELMQWPRLRTHFCRSSPMKSCRPMRANTLRQKTVRIITSASFLTDWIRAPTMVFRPWRRRAGCKNHVWDTFGGTRDMFLGDACVYLEWLRWFSALLEPGRSSKLRRFQGQQIPSHNWNTTPGNLWTRIYFTGERIQKINSCDFQPVNKH